MRQGHQHRRGRGRSGNNNNNNSNSSNQQNRKGQNPLTRTFESNGPDVKIRGTPAHIAEKYISLARDAKSSGDEVLAENYLQHAEHYNRIILAFREQQISQGGGDVHGGMGQRFRVPQLQDNFDDDEFSDDGDEAGGEQPPIVRGNEPQPLLPQPPFEAGERPERPERVDRDRLEGRDQPRHDRHDRQDRHQGGQRFDDRQRRPDQFRNRDRDHRDRDRGDRDRDRDGRQSDYQRHAGGQDRPHQDRPHADRQPGERQFGDRQHSDRQHSDRQPIDRQAPDRQPAERHPPDRQGEPGGFTAERDAQLPPQPSFVAGPPPEPVLDPVNGERPRADGPPAQVRPDRPERPEGGVPRRRERFAAPPAAHEQPEFLRRPVRRPRREASPPDAAESGGVADAPPAAAPVREDGGSGD